MSVVILDNREECTKDNLDLMRDKISLTGGLNDIRYNSRR